MFQPQRKLRVLDAYEIHLSVESSNILVGEIYHFRTTDAGQAFFIEVGKLSARPDSGDGDAFRSHSKISIFLDDSYEYDVVTNLTLGSEIGDRQFWAKNGIVVSSGPLPNYHPDLPDAIVRSLIDVGHCFEPAWAQVWHCRIATVLDGYGDLLHDD